MTYGGIGSDTREYVLKRAEQSNVLDRIDLESEADDAYLLSVIIDGALDEEFCVGQPYAANVADWVAELLRETVDTAFWEVTLCQGGNNEDVCGDEVYRTAGYETDAWPYDTDPRDR